MLGFSGPQAVEQTRRTIQGLAKLAVGARQQLKGQGPITEGEQALLNKAESGDIDDFTVPEIRDIAKLAERGARIKVRDFNSLGEGLKDNPDYAPIRQFFNVNEPAPYQPRTPQAATGTLQATPQNRRSSDWKVVR